jgi:hypothetical protein
MLDDDSFNGWVLIVVGALVATLCGTCTYGVVSDWGEELRLFALIVGGAPTLFGIWLLASGIERVWSAHRRD